MGAQKTLTLTGIPVLHLTSFGTYADRFTEKNMSSAFQPQTDDQSESMIKSAHARTGACSVAFSSPQLHSVPQLQELYQAQSNQ